MRIGDVTGIGWRAHAALGEARGEARVLATLSTSVYLEVAGEVLWVGGPGATPHARAVLITGSPRSSNDLRLARPGTGSPRPSNDLRLARPGTGSPRSSNDLRLALPLPPTLRPWRPEPALTTAHAAAALRTNAARLAACAAALGSPRGFGAWLRGQPLAFPLDAARGRADALARACADDDPARAAEAARALLGLGPGLTPSGDDLAGGAFFARALLARAGACDAARWRDAAAAVKAAATRLTHPIGAALLGDLLAGEGWAPLHDLAAALGRDDDAGALDAARRLTRLGHSSGWDLLAGFVAGARA